MVAGGEACRKVGAVPLVPHTDGSHVQLIVASTDPGDKFCTEYENPKYWVVPSTVPSGSAALRVLNWRVGLFTLTVLGWMVAIGLPVEASVRTWYPRAQAACQVGVVAPPSTSKSELVSGYELVSPPSNFRCGWSWTLVVSVLPHML